MKNYTITVNGVAYDVTVEEKGAGAAQAAKPAAFAAAAAPAPAVSAPAAGGAGSIKVEAGAAGKVYKIEAKVGQAMKAGETVIILEAMKMEHRCGGRPERRRGPGHGYPGLTGGALWIISFQLCPTCWDRPPLPA